ncbi:MAG TPA: RNA polymerase subunit sigma-70, partial [Acidimicrobiales bacterium]|nr:RNA polymerase subunit sigma-70 [Acidimicrobiales bacterium]
MVTPDSSGDAPLVLAAQRGDEAAFRDLVERHRPALHAHCYRMLASPYDADEAVQEALVRAWKGLPRFEGRSTVRTWLFRIATRTAIDVARGRARRELPIGAFAPSAPGDSPGPADHDVTWMVPYPTAEASAGLSPEATYLERESLELAFVAALQYLPAQQRAAFLLCDVLRYPAALAAEMLETTVAGVNSRLQRARAELRRRRTAASQVAEVERLGDATLRDLASRYARAIEESDLKALLDLLAEDAYWSMPPLRGWFDGREA